MPPFIRQARGFDEVPRLPWSDEPIRFPQRVQGQTWWLCTQDCYEWRRNQANGNILNFETGTEFVTRRSQFPYYQGEIYAATAQQLPEKKERVVKMKTVDGEQVPDLRQDPTTKDPYAPMVPLYEYDVDPFTGKKTIRTRVVGVKHFVELPDDPYEAEIMVREYRANHDTGERPRQPLQDSRHNPRLELESGSRLQNVDVGRTPGVTHEGAARTSTAQFGGHAPVARQVEDPGAPQYRNRPESESAAPKQSTTGQLAEELGLTEDVLKLVLKTGMQALAGATQATAETETETGTGTEAGTGTGTGTEADADADDGPWDRLGISRRTWYRRGKPDPDDPAVRASYGVDDSEPEGTEAGTGTEADADDGPWD
ncbi:MAG: hypothetical protein OXG35_16220, partial [Acidobacteria bacterium]|nr:hypothetical protein [Acidobacteriota bacterium]